EQILQRSVPENMVIGENDELESEDDLES
ncbi:MAG: hypothetical protein RJA81_979, partial [Planctomycetota bacterium]